MSTHQQHPVLVGLCSRSSPTKPKDPLRPSTLSIVPLSFDFFPSLRYFYVCVRVYLYASVCVYHVICVWMPVEARRGQQIPLELQLEVFVSHSEQLCAGNRERTLSPLEEQEVPLPAELWLPSPSPRLCHRALPKLSKFCPSSFI